MGCQCSKRALKATAWIGPAFERFPARDELAFARMFSPWHPIGYEKRGSSDRKQDEFGKPMKILADVSAGELVDKITILEIKLENIQDEEKRSNVAREYAALTDTLHRAVGVNDAVADLRRQLKAVNTELWRIEDNIRAQEMAKTFGAEFIALARSVYTKNDRRSAIKRQINMLTESDIVEEKSYHSY